MGKYWRLLAEYDAETTTYSECAGGAKASPYSPPEKAKLIGLRAISNRDAATSLTNHVQWKLTSSSFRPAIIEVGSQGSGLQTAPAEQSQSLDWEVDQEVLPSVDIEISARNVTADTPVTVSELLYGLFQN